MLENYRQQDLKYPHKKKSKIKKMDYTRYSFSSKELLRYFAEGCVIVGMFGYFFYRSISATFLLSPSIFFYIKNKKRFLCRKQIMNLTVQFKDALNSINASIQAGYSMENAFCEA